MKQNPGPDFLPPDPERGPTLPGPIPGSRPTASDASNPQGQGRPGSLPPGWRRVESRADPHVVPRRRGRPAWVYPLAAAISFALAVALLPQLVRPGSAPGPVALFLSDGNSGSVHDAVSGRVLGGFSSPDDYGLLGILDGVVFQEVFRGGDVVVVLLLPGVT